MQDGLEFVRLKLEELNVPTELLEGLCNCLDEKITGVLLYGSWARRDAGKESDLDILLASATPIDSLPELPAKLSISRYTHEQLRSAGRTLFGMHLARDGLVLYDQGGVLAEILNNFNSPDPSVLRDRIREFSAIFDIPSAQTTKYLSGLCKLARYLLRSAIYAAALADGTPCFSIKELAERFNDPSLTSVISSHPEIYPEASIAVLEELITRLQQAVGPRPGNKYRTIHALIVGYWYSDPELAYLATLTLRSDDSLPYSDIPKVIL